MASPETFRSLFSWMMGFVILVWVWTVALMVALPAEKTSKWEADYRIVAVCANKEHCSVPYGKLAEERTKGSVSSLVPLEPTGEVQESDAWLSWKTETGQPWTYEAKRSSWHFEQKIRYRLEGETPVLVEVKSADFKLFLIAMPLALFTVLGLYFRNLRYK
jgi:hypothetical protein